MGENPYAPPGAGPDEFDPDDFEPAVPLGSYRLGVVLGFLFGLWALIGCLVFAKADTKRGAKHGFLGRIGLTVVIVALAIAYDAIS